MDGGRAARFEIGAEKWKCQSRCCCRPGFSKWSLRLEDWTASLAGRLFCISSSMRLIHPSLSILPPFYPLCIRHDTCSKSKYSQIGRASGVIKQPLNVSAVTSDPQSTSTLALNTSPVLPFRRCTTTSLALMLESVQARASLRPESCAVVEAVNGNTWTGFQAVDVDEARRALK